MTATTPGGSDSSTTRECFTVTLAPPGVTTSPTNTTIVLGNSNTDNATVTGVGGVTPTGTVTFYVCGPHGTATACTTAGTKLGSVTLCGRAPATATSPSFTPLATGTYCFFGVYSGDGNYAGRLRLLHHPGVLHRHPAPPRGSPPPRPTPPSSSGPPTPTTPP